MTHPLPREISYLTGDTDLIAKPSGGIAADRNESVILVVQRCWNPTSDSIRIVSEECRDDGNEHTN